MKWILMTFLCLSDSPCQPIVSVTVGIPGWREFETKQQCEIYRAEEIEFQEWRIKELGPFLHNGEPCYQLWIGECKEIKPQ